MPSAFQSSKTFGALEVVGFFPKYLQVKDGEWTFAVDSLSRDDAVDAHARLLNAMLLQAFPEWTCDLMKTDVQELYDAIKDHHGPFDNSEISGAMMRVRLKGIDF